MCYLSLSVEKKIYLVVLLILLPSDVKGYLFNFTAKNFYFSEFFLLLTGHLIKYILLN